MTCNMIKTAVFTLALSATFTTNAQVGEVAQLQQSLAEAKRAYQLTPSFYTYTQVQRIENTLSLVIQYSGGAASGVEPPHTEVISCCGGGVEPPQFFDISSGGGGANGIEPPSHH